MAAEALATDLRAAHLTDTVGLDFCIYSGPQERADFVFNSVRSGDLPLS